jgi:uncharacterized protein with HEPN domain
LWRAWTVGDDLVRSAVLHKLTVVGEAAARISSELRQSYPEIPWADIVEFRNIAVHAYFSVDWRLVWNVAVSDAPALKRDIEAIPKTRYVP